MGIFRNTSWGVVLASAFLLTACARQEQAIPTLLPATPIPSATARPSQVITPAPLPTQAPSPTHTGAPAPTPTALPTLAATPEADITAPAGIIYGTDALWVTQDGGKRVHIGPHNALLSPDLLISPNRRFLLFSNSVFEIPAAKDVSSMYQGEDLFLRDLVSGEITNLTNNPAPKSARQDALWSPDSRYIFYCKEDTEGGSNDIWTLDIRTGGMTNLTHTPNIDESRLGFWPGPNRLIFTSRLESEDGGPFNEGHLSAMKVDGSEYQALSKRLQYDLPFISPDGQTLAGRGGSLTRWGESAQKINFKLVDQHYQKEEVSLETPAWAPDGRRIAWSVYAGGLAGVGVYDLEKNELRLFHLSEVSGGERFLPAPLWSPDGKWLAWDDWNLDVNRIGLWVIQPESEQETYLGKFKGARWSPDSRRLAFNAIADLEINSTMASQDGIWIAEIGTWTPFRTDLPAYTSLLAWYDPPVVDSWVSFPLLWHGDFLTVTATGSPLALRAEPAENALALVSLQTGQRLEVIAGPAVKAGRTWWKMRAEDGTEGWSAENTEWYDVERW